MKPIGAKNQRQKIEEKRKGKKKGRAIKKPNRKREKRQ
jgi:hypothetical protein